MFYNFFRVRVDHHLKGSKRKHHLEIGGNDFQDFVDVKNGEKPRYLILLQSGPRLQNWRHRWIFVLRLCDFWDKKRVFSPGKNPWESQCHPKNPRKMA